MATSKNLGIWMDHSSAHLMEFTVDPIETTVIESQFQHNDKVESLSKSENLMHNKEQHQQSDYYKKLGAVIQNYESVVIFGPTDAKSELRNILKDDHRFANIKIEVQSADNMTENQEHAFVKDYFVKNNFHISD